MAAIGEKIYDVDSQTVQQLDQQLNDASSGLAGKVNQLEATADLSNVNPYDPAKSYSAGNLALVDGRLQRANKATTGALNLADWEDPSPVAAVTANRAMVSDDEGKPIASDVTDAELAKIRGGAPIQDDDITDDDAFLHNATGTIKQTGFPALWRWIVDKVTGAASTILTDDLTPDRLLRTDENGKVADTGVRIFDGSNRMRQDISVTAVAADDRDILTKLDGDDLYVSQNRPYYTASIDTTVDDGETIPVSGTNVVSNVNEMTLNSTDNTITVPSDGVYSVGVVGPIVSGSVGNNTAFTIDILVNGALTGGFRLREYTNDRLSYQHVGCDVLLPLSAGDNISFKVEGVNLFGSANKYTRIKCIYECAK